MIVIQPASLSAISKRFLTAHVGYGYERKHTINSQVQCHVRTICFVKI